MNVLIETFNIVESGPVLAHDIAKALKSNGANVSCIICNEIENKDNWKSDFDDNNLFFWNLKKNRVLNIMLNVFRLKRKYYFKKFDYVIYTNPMKRDIIVGRFINYNENIFILHDAEPHSSTARGETDYVNDIMKKADNILILSKGYKELVREKYGLHEDQVLYMRHGLMQYPKYAGEFSNNDAKKTNFLFFGRIDGYKGLHVLAAAYKKIKHFEKISMTVAGNGDFREYEDDYNSLRNVTIINRYIGDEEIARLFSKPNTVVVLPYLDATQSGVIGMAFNYECPIIASDTGGIKEQLFDGKAGVLIKPGDVDDLYEKMMLFIINDQFYQNEKLKIQKYKEKMTWEYITKDLLTQLYAKGTK